MSPGPLVPCLPFKGPKRVTVPGSSMLFPPLTGLKSTQWAPLLKWGGTTELIILYLKKTLGGMFCSGAQHSKLGHCELELSSALTSRKYQAEQIFSLLSSWLLNDLFTSNEACNNALFISIHLPPELPSWEWEKSMYTWETSRHAVALNPGVILNHLGSFKNPDAQAHPTFN